MSSDPPNICEPRTIDAMWTEFHTMRLPQLEGRQLKAAQFVFYASAMIIMEEFMKAGKQGAGVPVSGWLDELNAFGASIGETERPMQ
jgi:hypothetical protein